jgi:preprotein translocase subunit SecB
MANCYAFFHEYSIDVQDPAMTDEQSSSEFDLKRIVVKDLSFEAPMGHSVHAQDWKPIYSWNLEIRYDRLADKLWEVILSATVTAKLEANIAYLIEAQQAGIVEIAEMEANRLDRILGIEVPKMIFPYLRETLDNVAVKGGFWPINLRPPDFDAMSEGAKSPGASSADGLSPNLMDTA